MVLCKNATSDFNEGGAFLSGVAGRPAVKRSDWWVQELGNFL